MTLALGLGDASAIRSIILLRVPLRASSTTFENRAGDCHRHAAGRSAVGGRHSLEYPTAAPLVEASSLGDRERDGPRHERDKGSTEVANKTQQNDPGRGGDRKMRHLGTPYP